MHENVACRYCAADCLRCHFLLFEGNRMMGSRFSSLNYYTRKHKAWKTAFPLPDAHRVWKKFFFFALRVYTEPRWLTQTKILDLTNQICFTIVLNPALTKPDFIVSKMIKILTMTKFTIFYVSKWFKKPIFCRFFIYEMTFWSHIHAFFVSLN